MSYADMSPLLPFAFRRLIRNRSNRFLRLAVLALLSVPSSSIVAQQTESISGVIIEAFSGQVLSGVRVTAVQEDRSTVTDREGRFDLTGVTPGRTVIRLQLDGYATEVLAVDQRPAYSAPIEFSLTPLVEAIQDLRVVVSPTPARQGLTRGRERLQFLDPRMGEGGGSVAGFLQGRVAGLSIQRKGNVGGGRSVALIRGRSSLTLNDGPLVLLDGVRLSGIEILDELPLSHVRSIEIVRGPEAENYGLGAGRGVIVIRTR